MGSNGSVYTILAVLLFLCVVPVKADLTDGLVLYLPFDENQGDVANDLSPNGFTGEITDSGWGPGKFGSALVCDGQGTFVEIAFEDTFAIQDGITMGAWVTANLPFNPEWRVIINAKKSGQGPWGLQSRAAGNLETFYDVQGTRVWTSSNSTMEPDVFHHVIATYDKEEGFGVYFDGVREDGGANSGGIGTRGLLDVPPAEGIVIAHNYNDANRWWDGSIDEVVIYNRALSEDEVAQLAEAPPVAQAITPQGKVSVVWGDVKMK